MVQKSRYKKAERPEIRGGVDHEIGTGASRRYNDAQRGRERWCRNKPEASIRQTDEVIEELYRYHSGPC